MDISQNSLYNNAKLFQLNSGEYLLNTNKFNWLSQSTDLVHTLKEDETLDYLAWLYYNNKRANAERYWWLIAKANNIYNPFLINNYIGKSLIIPDILFLDFVIELQS